MVSKKLLIVKKTESKLKKKYIFLKGYQVNGVEWMISRESDTNLRGGILADDPGLGKTIQTISTLISNVLKKTLIIVPTSIISQWKNSIEKCIDKVRVYVHHRDNKDLNTLLNQDFDICITTHGTLPLAIDKQELVHILWDRIILDEGHVIRNKKTRLFEACSKIIREDTVKWILTGTPIQNSKQDIISLFKFLDVDINNTRITDSIDKYVLRRTKDILIKSNTIDKYVIYNHCVPFKLRSEQEFYKTIERDAIDELLISSVDKPSSMQSSILNIYLRLRQCCVHPKMALTSIHKNNPGIDLTMLDSIDSTKIERITQDISKLNKYCLVFCHFKDEMNMIQMKLNKIGVKCEQYHGSLNQRERQDVINKFNSVPVKKLKFKNKKGKIIVKENKPRVLLIQINAGGVGLNLQQFSNVFIVSPDWNPCNEIQAISRSHRIGQQNKVNVHKYTVRFNPEFEETDSKFILKTIDERILSKQINKRNLMVDMLSDKTLEFKEEFDDGYFGFIKLLD